MKCEICSKENTQFSWTDTHGVAQCYQCGTPYVILHYEGEGDELKRVDKEPEIAVLREWVPLLREYWEQTHRIIPSGYSFTGGYERASRGDQKAFQTWAEENKHRANCHAAEHKGER
jgi:hypothetical protein